MAQSPDLVVPTACQVRLLGSVSAGTIPCYNVLGAIKLGATVINQALANTLAAAIRANFTTHLASLMPGGTLMATVGLRDISAANQTEYIGTGGPVVGTAVEDAMPGGAATCVSLKTALSGARHRGRVYISGWAESANATDGAISAAANSAAVAFVTAVQTSLAANGLTLAVVSRPSYAQQIQHTTNLPSGEQDIDTRSMPARPGEVTAVTSISARNTVWDSQRRRNGAGSSSGLLFQPLVMSYVDESTGAWTTVTSGGSGGASRGSTRPK
jgi:hypothetical protein